MDDDNVFRLGSIPGGKDKEDTIPENDYVVTDINGEVYPASGFLIFTPHHLAIMQDRGKGAIPVLVIPINRVVAAEIYDEDEDDEQELPL